MPKPSHQFAKKSLGQNFLTDENIIKKIVDAVGLTVGDTVIEIGPGRGALTERLVASGANVVAIELDRELVPFLRTKFTGHANFRVIEENALEADFNVVLSGNKPPANAGGTDKNPVATAPGSDAKLVANLPYYISTAILQRLAEQRNCFSSLVLMFQREVVERIAAQPGNSDRGFLTVIVEAAFSIERLFDVSPKAFRPVPKVWSSVVRLTPKPFEIEDEDVFLELVSTAFMQKRKTILNNLKEQYSNAAAALGSSGILASRRAETFTLSEWKTLNQNLNHK